VAAITRTAIAEMTLQQLMMAACGAWMLLLASAYVYILLEQ
jgi:hypothetical protein